MPPTCLDPWYAQSGEHVSADLWGVLKPVREAKHVKPWAPLTDGSLVCGLALRLNRAAAALLRKGGLDILLDIKAGKRPSLLKDAKPAAVVMLERADGALVLLRGIHVPKLSPGFRVGLRKGTTTWWHSGNHDIIFKSSNSKQRHWLDPQYWPDGEAAADKDVESKSDRILLKAFYEGRQPAWVLPLEQGQRDLDDGWLECPCPLQLRDPSDAPHQQQEEGSSHDDGMDLGTEHDEQEKEKGEADASEPQHRQQHRRRRRQRGQQQQQEQPVAMASAGPDPPPPPLSQRGPAAAQLPVPASSARKRPREGVDLSESWLEGQPVEDRLELETLINNILLNPSGPLGSPSLAQSRCADVSDIVMLDRHHHQPTLYRSADPAPTFKEGDRIECGSLHVMRDLVVQGRAFILSDERRKEDIRSLGAGKAEGEADARGEHQGRAQAANNGVCAMLFGAHDSGAQPLGAWTYRLKADAPGAPLSIGVIAQHVRARLPNATSEVRGPDGTTTLVVDYNALVAAGLGATAELHVRLERHEASQEQVVAQLGVVQAMCTVLGPQVAWVRERVHAAKEQLDGLRKGQQRHATVLAEHGHRLHSISSKLAPAPAAALKHALDAMQRVYSGLELKLLPVPEHWRHPFGEASRLVRDRWVAMRIEKRGQEQPAARPRLADIAELAAAGPERLVVSITGEAGAGKSTLAAVLAQAWARRESWMTRHFDAVIWLHAGNDADRSWRRGRCSVLQHWLSESMNVDDASVGMMTPEVARSAARALLERSQQGRVLWVVDGLDEVKRNGPGWTVVQEQLVTGCGDRKGSPRHCTITLGRPERPVAQASDAVGYRLHILGIDAQGWPWEHSQHPCRAFVEAYAPGNNAGQVLHGLVQASLQLQDSASNPLMLQLMCAHMLEPQERAAGGSPGGEPKRAQTLTDLLLEAVERMAQVVQEWRGDGQPAAVLLDEVAQAERTERVLASLRLLAWTVYERGSGTAVDAHQIARPRSGPHAEGRAVLETGLVTRVGPRQWAFVHRTLVELLAAWKVALDLHHQSSQPNIPTGSLMGAMTAGMLRHLRGQDHHAQACDSFWKPWRQRSLCPQTWAPFVRACAEGLGDAVQEKQMCIVWATAVDIDVGNAAVSWSDEMRCLYWEACAEQEDGASCADSGDHHAPVVDDAAVAGATSACAGNGDQQDVSSEADGAVEDVWGPDLGAWLCCLALCSADVDALRLLIKLGASPFDNAEDWPWATWCAIGKLRFTPPHCMDDIMDLGEQDNSDKTIMTILRHAWSGEKRAFCNALTQEADWWLSRCEHSCKNYLCPLARAGSRANFLWYAILDNDICLDDAERERLCKLFIRRKWQNLPLAAVPKNDALVVRLLVQGLEERHSESVVRLVEAHAGCLRKARLGSEHCQALAKALDHAADRVEAVVVRSMCDHELVEPAQRVRALVTLMRRAALAGKVRLVQELHGHDQIPSEGKVAAWHALLRSTGHPKHVVRALVDAGVAQEGVRWAICANRLDALRHLVHKHGMVVPPDVQLPDIPSSTTRTFVRQQLEQAQRGAAPPSGSEQLPRGELLARFAPRVHRAAARELAFVTKRVLLPPEELKSWSGFEASTATSSRHTCGAQACSALTGTRGMETWLTRCARCWRRPSQLEDPSWWTNSFVAAMIKAALLCTLRLASDKQHLCTSTH